MATRWQHWLVCSVGSLGLGACAVDTEAGQRPAVSVSASESALRAASGVCPRPVELSVLGSYATGIFEESAAEIVAHDPSTQRLFVVNAAQARVDVLDALDPTAPSLLTSLGFGTYGAVVNSVDVHDGVLAVAVEAHVKTDPGHVVLLDSESFATLAAVEVGALPDMLAFSPNGRFVLVANEGEPNADYSVDPEGSVSVINLSEGAKNVTQASVRTADFRAWNDTPVPAGVRIFGPGASVAQDLEPEYLTFSHDSETAWVTLQENNALARIDVKSAKVTALLPLGTKDHSIAGQGLDASDRDGAINIAQWPIHGLYLPDAIASYAVGGKDYLVLANEGDLREYEGFVEEARIASLTLDPTAFPNGDTLKSNANLGRLKVTRTLGDTDGDGDYDALYSIGARSFSIRRADGSLVWDSGDRFEQITAAAIPAFFNSDHTANAFDNRSDDKGPEPEGVTLGQVRGRTFAFVGLERVGGIMVFDISDPSAPCFTSYANNRDFSADPESAAAGDLGAEGLRFISEDDSPTGGPLLVVANEVSGTTTIFEVVPN